MATIKAIFEGKRIILPSGVNPVGTGEVMMTFPDGALSEAPRHSIWDVINRVQPSHRTVDEVNRELDELRAEWDEN